MTSHSDSEVEQLRELLAASAQARANAERRAASLEAKYERVLRSNALLSERVFLLREELEELKAETRSFGIREELANDVLD